MKHSFTFLILSIYSILFLCQTRDWVDSAPGSVRSAPSVSKSGTIYIGCDNETLYALNSDGAEIWHHKVTGKISASPSVQQGKIYFGTEDGYFYVLNSDGSLFGQSQLNGSVKSSCAISPDGSLFVATDSGNLYHLKANATINGVFNDAGPFVSSPVFAGVNGMNRIFVGSLDNKLYALDFSSSGFSLAWTFNSGAPIFSSPAIGPGSTADDRVIYLTANDNYIYKLNGGNGNVIWQKQITTGRTPGMMASPVLTNSGILIVASIDGGIAALDATSGNPIWTQTFNTAFVTASVTSTPALASGNRLYIYTAGDGTLRTLQTSDGNPLYEEYLGDEATHFCLTSDTPEPLLVFGAGGWIYGYKTPAGQNSSLWHQFQGDAKRQGRYDTAPNIIWTSPTENEVVGGIISLVVETSDDFGVEKVNFYLDNAKNPFGEGINQGSGFFLFEWDSTSISIGSHTLKAEAIDASGQSTMSNIDILVDRLPSVTWLSPLSGQVLSGTIVLSLTASDNGSVETVELKDDNTRMVLFASPPYTYNLDTTTLSEGNHTFRAIVIDNLGLSFESDITVIVDNIDDPPTVTFIYPVDGQTIPSGSAEIECDVYDDRGIAQVEFVIDGISQCIDTASPFTCSYNFTEGNHSISSSATDTGSHITTSTININATSAFYFADSPSPTFTWDANGDTKWLIQISKDPNFLSIDATSSTADKKWLNTTTWTPSASKWKTILNLGSASTDTQLYWRIKGKSVGTYGGESLFIAKAQNAIILSPVDDATVPRASSPLFTWQANHTNKYRVEFSDSKDFTSGVKVSSKTSTKPWWTSTSWTAPSGKWVKIKSLGNTVYWRITSKDKIGRTASGSSFTLNLAP